MALRAPEAPGVPGEGECERLRAEAERLGVSLGDLARSLILGLTDYARAAYGAGLRDGALCALAAVASGYLDAAALLGRPGEARPRGPWPRR